MALSVAGTILAALQYLGIQIWLYIPTQWQHYEYKMIHTHAIRITSDHIVCQLFNRNGDVPCTNRSFTGSKDMIHKMA